MSSSDRILRLIEHVVWSDQPRTQVAVAAAVGLPASTTSHVLADLLRLGFVDLVERRYVAGPRLVSLSHRVVEQPHLRHELRPTLERLAESSGETIVLTTERGGTSTRAGNLLHLDHVESRDPIRFVVAEPPGLRPMYPSAAGMAILAFSNRTASSLPPATLVTPRTQEPISPASVDQELEQIRRRGYAFQVEKRISGIASLAAPVRNTAGTVIAAISAIGPAERIVITEEQLASLLSEVPPFQIS